MRLHLLTTILLVLVGCASFEESSHSLHEGMSSEAVLATLGEQPQEDINEGARRHLVWKREYAGEIFDYVCTFQNDGLVRWGYPQADQVKLAVQREQNQTQAWGQALHNLNQSLTPSKSRCNSISIPPIARPGCHNVCDANGEWALICPGNL